MARKNGSRNKLKADLPHLFAKTGHDFVGHCQGGLGRDIAQGRARSAGGQYQAATRIHQRDQGGADFFLFVRDQFGYEFKGVGQRAFQPTLQSRQSQVLVYARTGAVTD